MNPDEAPGASTTPIHVPDEPYALALDEQQDLLYVGNLRGDTAHPQTGGISLFDVSRPNGKPRAAPTFLGASSAFFNPNVSGNFGITSLTLRRDVGQDVGRLYASSRFGTNVVDVIPSLDGKCAQDHKDIVLTAGSDAFTTPLFGAEIRGISFLPEGNGAPRPPALPPRARSGSTSPRTRGRSAISRARSSRRARRRPSCSPTIQVRARGSTSPASTPDRSTWPYDPLDVPRLIVPLVEVRGGRGPAGLGVPQETEERSRGTARLHHRIRGERRGGARPHARQRDAVSRRAAHRLPQPGAPMRPARLRAGLPARVLPWLLPLLAAACTAQPVLLPSRDFDRPTDVTFVCMETVSAATASAARRRVDAPARAQERPASRRAER